MKSILCFKSITLDESDEASWSTAESLCITKLPMVVYNDHFVPMFSLEEVMVLSSVSKYIYLVLHTKVQLYQELNVAASLERVTSIVTDWPNLRAICFKPVPKNGPTNTRNSQTNIDRIFTFYFENDEEESVYNHISRQEGGPATNIVDHELEPEPEPDQVQDSRRNSTSVYPRQFFDLLQSKCIQTLDLSGISNVQLDAKITSSVRNLILFGCHNMRYLENLKDDSCVVQSVDLSYSQNLHDLSFLENIATIDLSYCHSISDLSCLRNARSVNLNVCRSLMDVSPLANVHTVSLRNCPLVTDISFLGSVHTLTLSGCKGVSDVSSLSNVYNLNLNGCLNVSEIGSLSNVRILSLRKCFRIDKIEGLYNVEQLDISGCTQLTEIRSLKHSKNLFHLTMSGCKNVQDVSVLSHVSTVILNHCVNITGIEKLSSAKTLSLVGCKEVQKLGNLTSLQELYLNYCSTETLQNANNLVILNGLKKLDLSGCQDIVDASVLTDVQELILYRCKNVERLPKRGNHKKLMVTSCSKVTDLTVISYVLELDLRFCDGINAESIAPIARLTMLRELRLAGCSHLSSLANLLQTTKEEQTVYPPSSRTNEDPYEFCASILHSTISSAVVKSTDIAMPSLRFLDLSYCTKLEDIDVVANMKSLHEIKLRHCGLLKDVRSVGRVHKVDLSGCSSLEDLRCLESSFIHSLNLSDCGRLKDVSMLTGVFRLDLRFSWEAAEGIDKLRDTVPILRL